MTASRQPVATAPLLAEEDRRIHELVRGLHELKPAAYWVDLLITAAAGWTSFCLAVYLRSFSGGMLIATVIAAAALYRGLCFIHEISHQTSRSLPAFELVWNLLIGFPLLVPSTMYAGVHSGHHRLETYGTSNDPEYLPFARSSRMTVLFAVQSFLIPVALVVRFVALTPVALLWPALQKWLVVHASSLTMNPAFRREATPDLIAAVRRQSAGILALWGAFAALLFRGSLPMRTLAIWLTVSALISFINTLRTLGAHGYESGGESLDRRGQLHDSIDTPGAMWTELWAPVGLRYHALHHFFPGIPYHNLGPASRRIANELPAGAEYHRVRSAGLARSLAALYRKGRRTSKERTPR